MGCKTSVQVLRPLSEHRTFSLRNQIIKNIQVNFAARKLSNITMPNIKMNGKARGV